MKPRVSVLMPARDAAAYIAESISSILTQSFSDLELVILDDCSGDETWSIVQSLAARDGRIRAYRNETPLKIAKSRNKLLGLARADYIAWQDADDVSLPHRIEDQVALLDSHPRVGICGGWLELMDAQGNVLHVRQYASTDAALRRSIFKQSPVSQGTAMVRRSVLDTVGGFDENLSQAEDLDLSFRIGAAAEFANLQAVTLRCRFHAESVSTGRLRENISQTLFVRRRAARQLGYSMTMWDRVAQAATFALQWLPPRAVLAIFRVLRSRPPRSRPR